MDMRRLAIRLKRVDFPTFGRPTMVTAGSESDMVLVALRADTTRGTKWCRARRMTYLTWFPKQLIGLFFRSLFFLLVYLRHFRAVLRLAENQVDYRIGGENVRDHITED